MFLSGILMIVCVFFQGAGGDIFVSPNGRSGAAGTKKDPMRKLSSAIQKLRALRQGGYGHRITVHLAPGNYFLQEGLVLDASCSGSARGPSVISGPGARLIGGIALPSKFLKKEGKLYSMDLRKAGLPKGAKAAFLLKPRGMGQRAVPVAAELFDQHGPLQRARWPNLGFAHYKKVLDKGSVPRNRSKDTPPAQRETGPKRGGVFVFDHPRLKLWSKEPRGFAFGYWHWDWADELLPIASIEPRKKSIHLGKPHRYGLKPGGAFYLVNFLCELDEPGEYYIDAKKQKLWLLPRPQATRSLILSLLDKPLLTLQNSHDIHITGLQLESVRGKALKIQGGSRNQVRDCVIRNTGLSGILIQGSHNLVRNCLLEDLGASGIEVRGGNRTTLQAAGNEIDSCEIRRFGRLFRTYHPAIHIHGVGQHVHNNLLHHGPHSAILFDGNEHRIEKNEIHHVLLETGDCSAIYTGRDWTLHGTVIRWNFIHDLPGTPGRQQNAVYLDDMASGIRVEGNIFFRCNSGMLVGGGRDNRIAHNLFIDSKLGIRFDQRGVTWMAKKLKDPRTSTILRRLQAIPIQKEPWRSRYPSLRTYLSDRIGKPVGSSVVENVFYQTKLGTIADPKTVKVRGNLVKQGRPGIVEEKNGGLPFRMKRFALCPQGSLVFPPSLLTKSEGRVPRTKNEDHLPSKGGCFLRPSQRQVFDDCPNFSRRVLFYYCPKERKELGFPPDRGEMAEWPNATAC